MIQRRNAERIPLPEVEHTIERGLAGADATRAAAIEGLRRIREAKGMLLRREMDRLAKQPEPDAVRLAALEGRIGSNQLLVRTLTLEGERARLEPVRPDKAGWILHGRVIGKDLQGRPDLRATLADASGATLEQFGSARTDAKGYFLLRIGSGVRPPEKRTTATTRDDGKWVSVELRDPSSRWSRTDPRRLRPVRGRVDYIEIVIDVDTGPCAPDVDAGGTAGLPPKTAGAPKPSVSTRKRSRKPSTRRRS